MGQLQKEGLLLVREHVLHVLNNSVEAVVAQWRSLLCWCPPKPGWIQISICSIYQEGWHFGFAIRSHTGHYLKASCFSIKMSIKTKEWSGWLYILYLVCAKVYIVSSRFGLVVIVKKFLEGRDTSHTILQEVRDLLHSFERVNIYKPKYNSNCIARILAKLAMGRIQKSWKDHPRLVSWKE
jgi:hypothetical protein